MTDLHRIDDDTNLREYAEHGIAEATVFLAKHAAFENYLAVTGHEKCPSCPLVGGCEGKCGWQSRAA